jgi:hypothetical protein
VAYVDGETLCVAASINIAMTTGYCNFYKIGRGKEGETGREKERRFHNTTLFTFTEINNLKTPELLKKY